MMTKMASVHHNLVASIFVAIFVTFACTNVTADLVPSICTKAPHPPKCTQALRSDPRSRTASLQGLAAIAIEASEKQAKATLKLVQNLLNGAKTPQLRSRYSSCLENYQDSIDSLESCSEYLKAKDYASLDSYASGALDFPGTCDDDFMEGPPAEPSQLKAASAMLQDYCDVILLVSSRLSGRKIE